MQSYENPSPTVSRRAPVTARTVHGALRALAGHWRGATVRWRANPILARLEATVTSLSSLSSEIEARFLGCGEALQKQVELTARLKSLGQELTTRDDRIRAGETAIQRIAALSTQQLDLGREFATEVERLCEVLENHADGLRRLQAQQEEIERSFAPIRALQSLFRIESAALTHGGNSLFGTVAEEIRRLEAEVQTCFDEQELAFAQKRARVLQTASELHASAERHEAIASTKREDVVAARTRLETAHANAAERDQLLQRSIANIDRETDAVVLALQYQDITRQRLEHVEAAARDVCQRVPATAVSSTEEARRRHVLCRIQTIQLQSVQEDLTRASTTVADGLRLVLRELGEIESACLSVESLRLILAEMDAVATETIDAHQVSNRLMEASVATLESAIREARAFAVTTAGATDAMRRLAFDIHLMGLNAQVQAVHARSGSLEVLSQATSRISREAQTLSGQFEQKLIALTDALTALVKRSEAFRTATQGRLVEIQRQSTSLLTELEAENTAAKATVTAVGDLLQQLGAQAGELLESVDLAEFSRDSITTMRELFSALSVVYASDSDPETDAGDPLLTQALSRYTMESERAAHLEALGLSKSVTTPPADVASVEPRQDRGVPDATAPSAATPADATPAVPTPATPPAASSSLGDNVELF